MSIPYTSYSQLPLFTATTVHSHTEHNTPHQRLIDNDNNLQSQINTLSSTIGGLSGKSIINVSHLAAVPSSYSNPARGSTSTWGFYPKLSGTSNLLVCWMGTISHVIQYGIANFSFGFYPKIDGSIPNGGPVYLTCAGDAYEQTSAYVTPWRYITGLGAGNRNIQVEWYYVDGSGIWRGQSMANCSYLVVEIDAIA